MTDGEEQEAHQIWNNPKAAIWKYAGCVLLAVDLGQPAEIDEVTVRLLGGTAPGGGQAKSFPTSVEVFVSQDGLHYTGVGTFSRWNPEDARRFGIPEDNGTGWVHPLTFPAGGVTGRWIGLRIRGTGMTASDEITVTGRPAKADAPASSAGVPSDFTLERAQLYFHRPALQLATNAVLPVPVGLVSGDGIRQERLEVTLELPAGVELRGGTFGKASLEELPSTEGPDGGRLYRLGWTEELRLPEWRFRGHFGRLYLSASGWKDGQQGVIRWQYGDGEGWMSPKMELPVSAVTLEAPPRLETLMSGLGWWHPHENVGWPDALEAFRLIGFNTVPFLIGREAPIQPGRPEIKWLESARTAGFKVATIDMTLMRMLQHYRDEKEIYCQFEDGSTGGSACPSYRGAFWKKEVERFAGTLALLRPDFSSQDIEVWKAADRLDFDFGPDAAESRKCVRCAADYERSGLKNPAVWRRAKGAEMWSALMKTARSRVREAGGEEFRAGAYNFRPGQTYQGVWNFDLLARHGWIDHSQPASYLNLLPSHLEIIGNLVRTDRNRFPAGSVMPWLTPGDGGTVPGEAFTWAVVEAYANGAGGIWFWSNRYWDSDILIAYHRAMRLVAPAEPILTQGKPEVIAVKGEGRASAIRHGERYFILAADYAGRTNGSVKLELDLATPSLLRDAGASPDTKPLATFPAGRQTYAVPLEGARARAVIVEPKE